MLHGSSPKSKHSTFDFIIRVDAPLGTMAYVRSARRVVTFVVFLLFCLLNLLNCEIM